LVALRLEGRAEGRAPADGAAQVGKKRRELAGSGPARVEAYPRLVRAVLVVNPFATRVTEERLAAVEGELRRVADLRVLMTERPRHATELVTEACRGGVDALLVFSGDGGFNEALNGLESDVPIGFLPGGGTSVLPRALGLPADPVDAARPLASAIGERRTRRITRRRGNGRRFAFAAGVGLAAEAVRRVNELG